jgi:hypothetical protein
MKVRLVIVKTDEKCRQMEISESINLLYFSRLVVYVTLSFSVMKSN